MSAFIPELRAEPPAHPHRKGCVISAISATGVVVVATLILAVAIKLGVTVADSLLIVAIASVGAAWLGWKLHLACD